MTLRIYLARHGETDWNRDRRLQGSTDIPLNATGVAHAELLARRLAEVDLDHIYCSGRTRSQQTASALDGRAERTILDDLNEQALGCFEGKVLDGSDPELIDEFLARINRLDDTLDTGESYNQHYARVRRAVERILAAHDAGTLLIVGHGGTNALILRALLDLELDESRAIRQKNDDLYVIEVDGDARPRWWLFDDAADGAAANAPTVV